MKSFFDSPVIEEHVATLDTPPKDGTTVPDPVTKQTELMQSIRDDMGLMNKKTELDRAKETTPPNDPTSVEEHKKAINTLEEEVRNFDLNWKKQQEEADRQAQEKKALEAKQAEAIEGDRTPNIIEPKPQVVAPKTPVNPTPPKTTSPTPRATPVPEASTEVKIEAKTSLTSSGGTTSSLPKIMSPLR